jgi:hypothetical protein
MEEKNTEKKTYEEPTLVRHEELADITESPSSILSSGGVVDTNQVTM